MESSIVQRRRQEYFDALLKSADANEEVLDTHLDSHMRETHEEFLSKLRNYITFTPSGDITTEEGRAEMIRAADAAYLEYAEAVEHLLRHIDGILDVVKARRRLIANVNEPLPSDNEKLRKVAEEFVSQFGGGEIANIHVHHVGKADILDRIFGSTASRLGEDDGEGATH